MGSRSRQGLLVKGASRRFRLGYVVLVLAAPKAAPAPKAKAAANKDRAKGDYRLAVGNVIKQSVSMLHACLS